MKSLFIWLFSLLLSFGVLAGCSTAEQSPNETSETKEQTSETEVEETTVITISQDNGEEIIAEEKVEVEEGAILFDVMEENFELEATEDGFITSIEGVSQDEEAGKYWMYEVNGEAAMVGAKEYELEPGDEVTFDLHAME